MQAIVTKVINVLVPESAGNLDCMKKYDCWLFKKNSAPGSWLDISSASVKAASSD